MLPRHSPVCVGDHIVGEIELPAPASPSGSDPMGGLRAIGEAIGRSVTTGRWPQHDPQLGRRPDQVIGPPHHRRRVLESCVQERLPASASHSAGSSQTVRRSVVLQCSLPTPRGPPTRAGSASSTARTPGITCAAAAARRSEEIGRFTPDRHKPID